MHADLGPLRTWQQIVKTETRGAYDKGQKAESQNRPRKTPRTCAASWQVSLRIDIDRSVTGRDNSRPFHAIDIYVAPR
jgi:hypothetical protein